MASISFADVTVGDCFNCLSVSATMLENTEALPTSELHGWSAVPTLTSKRSSLQFYATTVKEDVRPTSLQRRTSELSSLLAPLEDPEETDDRCRW